VKSITRLSIGLIAVSLALPLWSAIALILFVQPERAQIAAGELHYMFSYENFVHEAGFGRLAISILALLIVFVRRGKVIHPAASHHSSRKPKDHLSLPAKAVPQQLRPNQLQARIKIASLVITQIEMASVYSPQLIQKQFPQVPLRNVGMERTVLVAIIRVHARITEELRGGWTNELCPETNFTSTDQVMLIAHS